MGLFDSAVGLLTGQGSATGDTPATSTAGPTTVTPTVAGTKTIYFGGENTNWIIIAAVVAIVFLLKR